MKKALLILYAIGLIPIASFGQTSSNSCAEADSMPSISADIVYNVSSFDGAAPSPNCFSGSADNGEWFKYTASADYYVYVTSELTQNFNVGSNESYDTRLHVFSGPCNNLVCIDSSDDEGFQQTSKIGFSAQAGETYYIAWDNLWDNRSFDFKLIEIDPSLLVTFTRSASMSSPGTDKGAVDMNGDFLDDIVSIYHNSNTNATNININYQQTNGSFNYVSHPLSEGQYGAFWSMAAGDFDRNGFNDLVYGDGSGAHVVKANSNGTGYSVAASSNSVFTQRTNFVDFDNDGNLDVFICDDTAPNEYFINDGNSLTLWEGDDSNAPISGGLGVYASGGNYGSVWVDYDSDGDADLFIAKCGGNIERRRNQLFRNDGNLSFTDVSVSANMNDALSTWSSAWGDYDSDGDMDCFVGSSLSNENHKYMRNDNGVFVDDTSNVLADGLYEFGHENVPYDFNNDGYIDIFSNGSMLLNKGDGTFAVYYFNTSSPDYEPQEGAVGDLNNDGFLDVFSLNNVHYNNGNSNNWLKIGLIGTESNINGIGARIEVSSPSFNNSYSKKAQIRDVRSAEGFTYMSSLNAHFGLGTDTTVNTVTIYWPSGTVDVIINPDINKTLIVTEGETLSLQSTITNDLILYPNPTKRLLNLNSNYNFQNAIYSVFDITGGRVLNSKLDSNAIDVSELSSGNYILRIIDKGIIKTQKFIKQ